MVLSSVLDRRVRVSTLAGVVGLSVSIVIALSSPAEAARRKRHRGPAYSPPYAAMVVDAKTGRVLHAQNEDAPRHPASVTKVMTLYLLFEQLEQGPDRPRYPASGFGQRLPPGALEAWPEAGLLDRRRGRDPGPGDEIGERRRRRGGRESRRLRGDVRRADDAQGARARHDQHPLPQRFRPPRSRADHDGPRPHDPRPGDPGALPEAVPLLPDPRLQLRRRRAPQPQQAPRPGRGRRRHQDRLHARFGLQPPDLGPHRRAAHRGGDPRRPFRRRARCRHGRARQDHAAPRLCRRPHRAGDRGSVGPAAPGGHLRGDDPAARRAAGRRDGDGRVPGSGEAAAARRRRDAAGRRDDDADHHADEPALEHGRAADPGRSAGLCAGRGGGRAAAAAASARRAGARRRRRGEDRGASA